MTAVYLYYVVLLVFFQDFFKMHIHSDYSRHGSGGFPSKFGIPPRNFDNRFLVLWYSGNVKSSQVCPGPKNYVFVSSRTSYSRHKTSCTVMVDKVKHIHFICIIYEFIFFCYGVLYLQVATLAVRYQIWIFCDRLWILTRGLKRIHLIAFYLSCSPGSLVVWTR